MATATAVAAPVATAAASVKKAPKQLPAPNSDFYQLADVLTAEEKATVKKVRTYMETKVQPIINKYWSDDAFPFELLPSFKELGLGGLGFEGYGCAGGSQKLFGFVAMEIARVDASFCTFFGVHSGLAMGSIYLDGSEEQKQKWLPPMARFEKIGCFGLTEPLVGSGTSGGMTDDCEARRRHLDSQRPEAVDRQRAVVRYLDHLGARRRRQPGQGLHRREQDHARLQRREDRAQDRAQGGPERPDHAEGRPGAGSEPPAGRQLLPRHRARAAHDPLHGGLGIDRPPDGCLRATLKYAQERLQFGKPIASFQMVQDLLAKMLANVTACQCLMVRLAQMDDEGKLADHHASLAKAFCTAKSRETVAWGRELLGGNGIVADYNVARFFADAEALYSYEGTYQMQNLILGKAITGLGAFV